MKLRSYARTNAAMSTVCSGSEGSHESSASPAPLSPVAMTSQPTNESELQLYRVLQRANLLSYYDTFICQGGDDVQQLCEAGEEEFLEIMALVNMATKPLHVRRLQKALQEWVQNPAMFQTPMTSPMNHHGPPFSAGGSLPRPAATSAALRPSPPVGMQLPISSCAQVPSPSSMGKDVVSQQSMSAARVNSSLSHNPPSYALPPIAPLQQNDWTLQRTTTTCSSNQESSAGPTNGGSISPSSPAATPTLDDGQVLRLAEVADSLVRSILPTLSPLDIKTMKKRISKEMEYILTMSEDDPQRMEEIRKYAAIYGRFDCKRKPEKPLTLHEVLVNEAAAQICKHIPALLSRRDELFPLARQVVRESGFHYTKPSTPDEPASKRPRHDTPFVNVDKQQVEDERRRRQERLESVSEQLRSLGRQQEELKLRLTQFKDTPIAVQCQAQLEQIAAQQMQLLNEQAELSKQLKRIEKYIHSGFKTSSRSLVVDGDKGETDDTDSQLSATYSNTSSPSHDTVQGSPSQDDATKKKTTQLTKQLVQETLMDEGLRVIKEFASQIRGDDNCNAVPNDALSMTSTVGSSPSPIMPLSLTHKPDGAGGRPRGRPPRLDRGDYVGTSRTVPANVGLGTACNGAQNGSADSTVDNNGSGVLSLNGNGISAHEELASNESSSTENSLNALMALSQKGMKQEPPSPSMNIKI